MGIEDIDYKEYWNGFMAETDNNATATKEESARELLTNPFSSSSKHFSFIFNTQTTEIEKAVGVKEVLGYEDETFTNALLYSTYHPDDFDKYFSVLHESFLHTVENGEVEPLDTVLSLTCRNRHSDGHYVHLHYKIFVITADKDGNILKTGGLCKDISQTPFEKFTASLKCKCNSFTPTIIQNDEHFSANYLTILSKRELQILDYIIENKSSSEMGMILSISKHTVDKHIGNIFKKGNVKNRIELLALIS